MHPKTKILIVEDEEAMRVSMSVLLQSSGYEVDEASDGEEGLQKAQKLPDLIISDIEMPRMTG